MSMGRRGEGQQQEIWVAAAELPRSPGHAFYDRLDRLLAEAGFDRHVEGLCSPHYSGGVGRGSIPPGVYFRMLLVGYFEGLDSQRAIAWRCSDSLSLRPFLGTPLSEATPDHSSLTRIRQRLPLDVHERVFAFVLAAARERGLLKGKTAAVDSTTLEANAAMRSIARRDTGEGYKDCLKRLMAERGVENPTDDEVRRFDRGREKKGSSKEWRSPADPDGRVAKMKDGTTHPAYKAEHAVDIDSGLLVAASVYMADQGDHSTPVDTVLHAQINLLRAGGGQAAEGVVADKGYHKSETLAVLDALNARTYVPEPKRKGGRKWADKPEAWRRATAANRRRVRGGRGERLQRKWSELVERSFAHVCETGGARRTWLRGLEDVTKRYAVQAAAFNLGALMRRLFGVGKPRTLQGACGAAGCAFCWLYWLSAASLGRTAGRPGAHPVAAAA